MTELILNPEEAELLEQVLGRCVSDLEMEIAHTDHAEFRKLLKQRRSVLSTIHARLAATAPAPPVAAPRL
jgi:hypothetical protein